MTASAGFAMFPCYPRDIVDSAGKVIAKVKSPMVASWKRWATTDEKQIGAFWTINPDALPAIDLERAGLTVIDADNHGNGQDGIGELNKILAANGYAIDAGPWVESPHGIHLYFRTPPDCSLRNGQNRFPWGIEVKTAGGYIIAPGTRMPDGSEYVLHGDLNNAPELPDFFQAFAQKPPEAAPKPDNIADFKAVHADRRVAAYVEAAMRAELHRLATMPKGNRNVTLNKAAFSLGQLIGAGWIGEDQVIDGLVQAAEACGVIGDKPLNAAMKTIRSGLKAGIAQPRQLPDEAEVIDPVMKEGIRKMTVGGRPVFDDVDDWQPNEGPYDDPGQPGAGQEKAKANDRTGPKCHSQPIGTQEINAMLFPPIRYVVPGYIAEGCTLLAGRPKVGKSWLCFDMLLAVATEGGGQCLGDVIITAPGESLYISLEDNLRRLQKRLRKIVPGGKDGAIPKHCYVVTEWPRAPDGGLDRIRDWLRDHPATRLIVIDSLPKFRAIGKSANVTQFDADFVAVQGLQEITSQYPVAIVVVVHTRKAAAESGDPMDKISGTLGLSAAADAILVLDKDPTGAFTLYGRGRDTEEIEAAISFNRDSCRWMILGKAGDVRQTANRAAVLAALDDAAEPMSVTEIAAVTGQKAVNLRQVLRAMVGVGQIANVKRGRYQKPPVEDRINGHDLDESIG